MIERNLPPEWLQNPPAFLMQVVQDRELHPEIRNNSITVYYRGKAVIRDIRLRDGTVTGSIHYKYVPIDRPALDYVQLTFGEHGFQFANVPVPLAPGHLDASTIAQYKRMMRSDGRNEECGIIDLLVSRAENLVIDQEVKFQDPGDPAADKIDLCVYDTHLSCLSLVEVKSVNDPRLLSGQNEIPEVIDQLIRYENRIRQNSPCLIRTFTNVVSMKRTIGMQDRLVGVPCEVSLNLLARPVLVIGNCTAAQVTAFLNGMNEWEPLLQELRKVAAGLIVCGHSGGRLRLDGGLQRLVFDQTIYPAIA